METKTVAQQQEALRQALERIAAIENKPYGGDWDEIEEARHIAKSALAAQPQEQPVAAQQQEAGQARELGEDAAWAEFQRIYVETAYRHGNPDWRGFRRGWEARAAAAAAPVAQKG